MIRFLFRNLAKGPMRVALSVGAIASVLVLITVFEGFKSGISAQVRAYPESLDVPLVAIQAGADAAFVRSGLPDAFVHRLARAPEVARVHPVLIVRSIFEHDAHKTPVSIVGYRGGGGPWRVSSGRMIVAPDDAVLDTGLTRKFGLGLGDEVTLLGRPFKIVGVSDGTSSLLGSYVFLGFDALGALAAGQPVTDSSAPAPSTTAPTMLLIELAPGVSAAEASAALESLAGGDVALVTPSILADRDVRSVADIMGSATTFLVYTAYVVGLLVIGLTFYGGVIERQGELGTVRALGAGGRWLISYVLAHGVALTAISLAAGLIAAQGVARLIPFVAPQYLVVAWEPDVVLRTSAAAFAISLLASLFPAARVARLDPAAVFRR